MPLIIIETDSISISVTPTETETAQAIIAAAPFTATARTWGEEVYFDTPLDMKADDTAKDVLEFGEIAFWLAGNCIALGFGRTPVSIGDEIRLASVANVWGHSSDDLTKLAQVRDGDEIRVQLG